MDWELFTKLAYNFGFPVVCVVALSLTLYRAGKWLGEQLIKPAISAHIELVGDIRSALAKDALHHEKQDVVLERIGNQQDKISETMTHLSAKLKG